MDSEPVKTGSSELTKLVKTGSNQSSDSVKTASNESAEPTKIGSIESSELVNTASVESDMFEEEEEDSMRLYLEPDTEKTDSSDDLVLSSQKDPADTTIDEKTG